jgi:hypothetical protein
MGMGRPKTEVQPPTLRMNVIAPMGMGMRGFPDRPVCAFSSMRFRMVMVMVMVMVMPMPVTMLLDPDFTFTATAHCTHALDSLKTAIPLPVP